MSTEPTPEDALRSRAERGEPRGADAVLAAARTHAASADAPDGDATLASAGGGHRWMLSAAAAVLVLVIVGAAIATKGGSDSSNASGGAFCDALEQAAVPPYDIDADVIVYLVPNADESVIEQARANLADDERVAAALYIDADETYARFRELFRDQPTMLENVRKEDLPTSFEVTAAPGASPAEMASEWRRTPMVWEVRDRNANASRVLDVLVWPGQDPRVVQSDFIHRDDPSTYAGWVERVADARREATPEAAQAIELLARTLRERQEPLTADDPAAAPVAAAAATLARAAASECGLEPRPPSSPLEVGADHAGTTTTTAPNPTTTPGG